MVVPGRGCRQAVRMADIEFQYAHLYREVRKRIRNAEPKEPPLPDRKKDAFGTSIRGDRADEINGLADPAVGQGFGSQKPSIRFDQATTEIIFQCLSCFLYKRAGGNFNNDFSDSSPVKTIQGLTPVQAAIIQSQVFIGAPVVVVGMDIDGPLFNSSEEGIESAPKNISFPSRC